MPLWQRYNVEIRWAAIFDVDCEDCGKHFTFTERHTSDYTGYTAYAREFAMKRMVNSQETLKNGGFISNSPQKCPKCGHIQSWMVPAFHIALPQHYRTRALQMLLATLLVIITLPAVMAWGNRLVGWIVISIDTPLMAVTIALLFKMMAQRNAEIKKRTMEIQKEGLKKHSVSFSI